jgi:hypothetical protein
LYAPPNPQHTSNIVLGLKLVLPAIFPQWENQPKHPFVIITLARVEISIMFLDHVGNFQRLNHKLMTKNVKQNIHVE